MEKIIEYAVTVSHPKWLPEGETTVFTDNRLAARLEGSALQAGFDVNTVKSGVVVVYQNV